MKKPQPSGNALFLILIAVALFAALSYAVTTSGRGGGTIDGEQILIDAAQMTEYGAMLRQTVTRMALTGTPVSDIEFCDPADGECIATGKYCTTGVDCVFAVEGGGNIAPSRMNDSFYAATEPRICKQKYNLDGIGTTANDTVIAMMLANEQLCREINKGLTGSTAIPMFDINGYFRLSGCSSGTFVCSGDACQGEAFLCAKFSADLQIYYHALTEE